MRAIVLFPPKSFLSTISRANSGCKMQEFWRALMQLFRALFGAERAWNKVSKAGVLAGRLPTSSRPTLVRHSALVHGGVRLPCVVHEQHRHWRVLVARVLRPAQGGVGFVH